MPPRAPLRVGRTRMFLAPVGVTNGMSRQTSAHSVGDPFEVKGELFSSSKVTVLLCPL